MNTKGITVIALIAIITVSIVSIAYLQYRGNVQGCDKIIADLSAKDLTTLGNPTVSVSSTLQTLTQLKRGAANSTIYYQRSYDGASFYLIVSGSYGTGTPPVYQSVTVISWTTRWDGSAIFGGSLLNP
jgi:hypothetical protein